MRFSLRSWMAAAGAVTLALAFSACQTTDTPVRHIKTEVKDGPLVPKADSDGYTVYLRCFTAEEANAIESSIRGFDGYQDLTLKNSETLEVVIISNGVSSKPLTVREYLYQTSATASELDAKFFQELGESASIDLEDGVFTIDKIRRPIHHPCENLVETGKRE